MGSCVVVRDADPTNPFGSSPASGTDYYTTSYSSATSYASGALTTAVDDALVFYSFGYDGGGSNLGIPRASINDYRCITRDKSSSAVLMTVGYYQQEAAGAIPSTTTYKTVATVAAGIVCAVRNKSGGARQPDIRAAVTHLRWYGTLGALVDATTTWQSMSNFAASIGTYLGSAINCSTTIGTTSNANATQDPDRGWDAFTILPNSDNASSVESAAGVGIWAGGTHTISSTDMTGKLFVATLQHSLTPTDSVSGNEGWLVGFSDGTNWVVYQVRTKPMYWQASVPYTVAIAVGNADTYASSGSINWAAVTRIAYAWHRGGSVTTAYSIQVRNAMLVSSALSLIGGGDSRPAVLADMADALASWGDFDLAGLQGGSQTLLKLPTQIGNGGTDEVYFDHQGNAVAFPPDYSPLAERSIGWNCSTNAVALTVYAGADDTIGLAGGVVSSPVEQTFTVHASSSTSATYDFSGMVLRGYAPTLKTGIDMDGVTFIGCGEIAAKGCNLTDCTISDTTSTDAAVAFDTSGVTLTRCTIDVTGTSAAYHLELGASVTGITLTDVTFTGTPGTDKVHVKATTGTVTITLSGTTTLVSGDVTSDGATVVIDAPAVERGLNFTGLVAGSQVKVFDTGTTTERFTTSSSGTSEEWSETTAGSVTIDYTIMRAGYRPIRVTGITVTAALSGGVIDTPIQQQVDRAYVASSGLTYGSNTSANTGTKRFGLTAASTVQNFYSHMIETWIAETAFKNVQFPITPNGSTSFSFDYGWEWDGSTSIAYLSNDGMRYTDGSVTAQWVAINSVGVPTGVQARYQQTDGSGTTNGESTGNVSQLIHVYGDASHGNFDKRGHMVWKVQAATYDEAEFDVVANYGTLEDQVYVVGLAPTANGVAGAAITTGVTITDHGASPVTWNSVVFSVTITSDRPGEEILQYIRNANNFNYHDLVRTNGTAYKTVRGAIYGDTGASIKGVRVLDSGGDAHPDFTLFTGDDGTTYSPPVIAAVTATVLADTRVVLYNDTQDTEIDNTFVSGTSYSYTITTEADDGDQLTLHYFKEGYEEGSSTLIWSQVTTSFVVAQTVHPYVDALRTELSITDYTDITEFAPDTTGHVYIEADDVDGSSQKARAAIWYNGILTTEGGARHFRGGMTILSTAAFRINVDEVDMLFENVNATTPLVFTDLSRRLYRSNGTSIIAPGSYSIHNDYSGVPDVVETGVSGLTGSESAQLMALPSASDIVTTAIDGTTTLAESLRLSNAVLGGKVSGAGTGTETFRNPADTKDRLVVTVDSSGNRTALTRDLT